MATRISLLLHIAFKGQPQGPIYEKARKVLELDMWAMKYKPLPVIQKVEDLKPYRLGLMSGYGYGGSGAVIWAEGLGYRWTALVDREQAFRFLEKGRADFLLDYGADAEFACG